MKCEHCGKEIFPGQFRCDHCGTIQTGKKEKDEKKNKED